MNLSEAIHARRATRAFLPQPVDRPLLERLIDAAIQAPSAMNTQPWAFHVVTNQSLLARLSSETKHHLLNSTVLGTATHHFEAMLSDEAFHIFYHAPVVVVICAVDDNAWAQIDCALAAQNLMLSAVEAGLGSCWIGFAQIWLNTPEGRALLDIPAGQVAVAPIALGYPSGTAPAVPRQAARIVWND